MVNICLMLGVASLTFSLFVCVSVCLCVRILVNLPHRLQMENELRQREREQEREREKEREREAGLEREREREREREEERERERELERQKERQRERQQQMVRAAEGHYLAELHARRAPPEDRARPGERLTPNRLGTYTQTRVYMYVRSPAGACIQSFRNGFIYFFTSFQLKYPSSLFWVKLTHYYSLFSRMKTETHNTAGFDLQ